MENRILVHCVSPFDKLDTNIRPVNIVSRTEDRTLEGHSQRAGCDLTSPDCPGHSSRSASVLQGAHRIGPLQTSPCPQTAHDPCPCPNTCPGDVQLWLVPSVVCLQRGTRSGCGEQTSANSMWLDHLSLRESGAFFRENNLSN